MEVRLLQIPVLLALPCGPQEPRTELEKLRRFARVARRYLALRLRIELLHLVHYSSSEMFTFQLTECIFG